MLHRGTNWVVLLCLFIQGILNSVVDDSEVNQFEDYSQTNLDQSPPVLRDFLPLKSPSGKMDWNSYKSYEDHLLFYRHLLKSFKHVGTKVSKIKTHEGRRLSLYTICHNGKCGQNKKPAIWVDGAIHGRELVSPAAVAYLFSELAEKQDKPENRNLVEWFDWYFMPFVNPDGYVEAFSGDGTWRKNKSPNNGSICKGVDLNRNFGFKWKHSADMCSQTYPGVSPFSEPETQAVKYFVNKIKDRLILFNTVHTAGQAFVIAWGHEKENSYKGRKKLKALLEYALKRNVDKKLEIWRIGNTQQLLNVTTYGGAVNYATHIGAKYAFATELGDKDMWKKWKGPDGYHRPPEQEISHEADTLYQLMLRLASKVYRETTKKIKKIYLIETA